MNGLARRQFLSRSLGGIAAGWTFGQSLFAQESKPNEVQTQGMSGPDTLFLTWHQDPTTSITVQWVGRDVSTDCSIHFATVENPVWQIGQTKTKPYPNTNWKVHRCEIGGLKPGTEYQFQIAMNSQTTYRFRTMPQKATNTIQWISGGDCGVDEHAVNSNRIAAKQDPYFVLIAGDLAYDNGTAPETFTKFLQNYHRHMVDSQGRLIPMVACLGNHEVQGGYNAPREKGPQYFSVFDGFFSQLSYGVFDVGDYLSLVLMDTGHVSPIAGEQTDWLGKTLKERQDRPHLIVANHVPAYPSYRPAQGESGKTGTGEDQRKYWCPLFERFNVDVVLEHHDHMFKRSHPLINGMKDKNGVLYLGDGSWGKLRVPKAPEERPYLAAMSSTYHVTVHRLEGDERFHVALNDTGKVADVCRTINKRAAS